MLLCGVRPKFLAVLWAAALCHELAHLCALRLQHCPVRRIRVTLTGLRIDYRPRTLSYRADALTALAGPAGSMLAAVAAALIAHLFPLPVLFQFVGVSAALGVFNLLPALPLDGGRALSALLSLRWDGAATAVCVCGLALGAALVAVGLFLLTKGGNPSLLCAGALLLFENALQRPLKTVE